MNIINIIGIGIGLAMDAFAVSIADGSGLKTFSFKRIIKPALFFAIFQAIMPIIGWLAGNSLYSYVSNYGKYISAALLIAISVKMAYDAIKNNEINSIGDNYGTLIILSVATSIDALVVGVSFALLQTTIIYPAIIIGIITFITCLLGGMIGYKIGNKYSAHSAFFGAIVLMLIALKILFI